MKTAVIGAGAIGSIIAGYLKEAGADIVLVGRRDHIRAVQERGLLIKGIRGDKRIDVPVSNRLESRYDLVVFATKTQDLESAYQDNAAVLEEGALVLTTQNGVQAENMISTHFDKSLVISSIVMFGATYIRPGEVTHNFEGEWMIGKPFMTNDKNVHEIAELLGRTFAVEVTQDIVGMKWLKLFVNFNNCLPALVGKSMQETFADMDLCRLSVRLLREGYAVVQKAGIGLVSLPGFPAERVSGMVNMPEDQAAGILSKSLTTLSQEPLYGSVLQSILRDRPSEIDFINGEVVALAKNIGIQAPLNEKVVDMVHDVERTRHFFATEDLKKEFIKG